MIQQHLKTWIEISRKAVENNVGIFRKLVGKKSQIWAVVKSNAYGHGLVAFSQVADKAGVDGFCVDSVLEGIKLRQNGIKKMILVLGPTLPGLFKKAVENKITITISNKEALKNYLKSPAKPDFHLKIDSGMHRQGFYPEEIPDIISSLKKIEKYFTPAPDGQVRGFTGTYTHFCSAKDINYPTYTEMQLDNFKKAIAILESAGFKNLIKHAAATGGTMIDKKYHFDAVRIGIGLYGLWPSKELNIQMPGLKLQPVLSWHALVSEVKKVKKGEYIGYDLAERATKNTDIAVIPIGYWHGFPRALSSVGQINIAGKTARILGRVSMDLIVADVNGLKCRIGSEVVIIGRHKSGVIGASDMAAQIGASHYELVTRINPLIERIII